MRRVIIAVMLACFAGVAAADDITEIDKNVIEAYLQPDNSVSFVDLYLKMTGKQFVDVKDHIKFLQNTSAVKNVWDQDIKEDKAIDKRVIEEFLKPKNKLFLIDLYVKMTGNSYDVAEGRCKWIARNNDEVKAKWNRQYDEAKKRISLIANKRNECDGYLKQANVIHPTINYKQHNKCVAYNDINKIEKYSDRSDYQQTVEQCLDSEVEFSNKLNEFESLLEKQKACTYEIQTM